MKQNKNKLKEFFRPTKGKVIIFIILLLLFSLLPIFKCKHIFAWVEPAEGSDGGPIEVDVISPLILVFIGGYFEVYSCSNLYFMPILVIIAYLLSCLIIFMWNKKKIKMLEENRNNEVKKKGWRNRIKQPFFWIALWIMIPFFLYVISRLLFFLNMPFMGTLLLSSLGYLFLITPIVLLILCIWAFVHGLRMLLKQKDKKLIAVLHIVLSLIIFLLMVFIYWMLTVTFT